jgi:hypothetical protein
MKPDQIIFVSSQGWVQLAQGKAREIEPWSDLQGSALVVVDFVDSQIAVQACKGKAEYAGAQIEKTVRSEGAIEGPLQVFVHRQVRHADSSLALYTALSLEAWQQFQTWAERQPDHCLVVPLAGLFHTSEAEEQVQILRVGSQLHAYGAAGGKIQYATASALGKSPADFHAPLRSIFAQLRAAGWDAGVKTVRWSCALSKDLEAERALLAELAEAGIVEARLHPHEAFKIGGGDQVASALPHALESMESSAIQAPWLTRMAWLSETYVLPLAAMVAVVSMGLLGFAFFSQQRAAAERVQVRSVQAEVEPLRQRVSQAALPHKVSMAPEAVAFVRELGYASTYDPIRMLATVRRAAGYEVRVQRLQLSKANHLAAPLFRVDGVVIGGSNEVLSRFLGALKARGWQAESAVPNDSTLGAFSYTLIPVEPGAAR